MSANSLYLQCRDLVNINIQRPHQFLPIAVLGLKMLHLESDLSTQDWYR